MASFMTRVELHGATYQDYTNLHAYMAQEGFTNTIRSSDGALYQLPPAEHELIANCSTVQAREKASKAATRTVGSDRSACSSASARRSPGMNAVYRIASEGVWRKSRGKCVRD